MNPLAIRALIVAAGAAAAFAAGWAVNGWRLGEKIAAEERDRAEKVAVDIESARLVERAHTKRLEDARNAATQRETAIRRDADGARAAAVGLRDELDELRRGLPGLAVDACRQRADTLAQLFDQCSGNYRSLAETADRVVSDRKTLIEAWPK